MQTIWISLRILTISVIPFRRFAELLPADGTLIINADTPKYEDIIRDLPCNVITYGLEHDADYQAADILMTNMDMLPSPFCAMALRLAAII